MNINKNAGNEPVTKRQKAYIANMMEFSDFPLPRFTGTTKKEASEYISRYNKMAHESFDFDGHADNYGDR